MNLQQKRYWILAAAVGMAFASAAPAQQRIQNGRALDANNRVGGGGLNEGGNMSRDAFNSSGGNEIVTGNVTGGRQFRGSVPYRDAKAFHGNTSLSTTDAFTRQSSAAPVDGVGGLQNSNANTVRAFYGDSRAVAPPPGFAPITYGSSGFVPAAPEQRLGSDLRLGNPLDTQTVALPRLGETVMAGPIDPSNNNTLITASSLYGVRQWNAGSQSDQEFISRFGNPFDQPLNAPLTTQQLNKMRTEVDQSGDNSNDAQNGGVRPLNRPLGAPIDAPNNAAVSGDRVNSTLPTGLTPGQLSTGESVRAQVQGINSSQNIPQTSIQAKLDQRSGAGQMSDVQAAAQYNRDLLTKRNADEAAAKANGAAAGMLGLPGQPSTPGTVSVLPGNGINNLSEGLSSPASDSTPQAPTQVKSLSSSVKAQGLADLMKKSEDLMRDGKWFSAMEQYELARQVAPNNMLVMVGRANAELGGSYYTRAEADLRTAFNQDPSTMNKQYDLRSMIGDDRLQFLVNDLKDINGKQPDQAMPVFLLAYISYNTGNERMATGYLDLAAKRARTGDTFYSIVQHHWALPPSDASPAPTLNK